MSQVINTNIMSLTAQRNLNSSQSALATSMQRLSSGLRINSAKDDAAGLAISTRFTTQINGLNQAVRNANDGISLAQTTESALSQVTDNLQRIRELAVQSANATNSDSDRAALDTEVQQRLSEITRISTQTSFNGRHVLDSTFGKANFQIGANVGETISVDLSQGARADQIGQVATEATGDISSLFASPAGLTVGAGELTVQLGSGTAVDVASGTYNDAQGLADAINTAATSAGVTGTFATVSGNELSFDNAEASDVTFGGVDASKLGVSTVAAQTSSTVDGAASSSGLGAAITGSFNAITLQSGDFTIGGADVTGTFKDAGELKTAIDNLSSGLTVADNGDGTLDVSNNSGGDITIAGSIASDLGLGSTITDGAPATTSSDVPTEVASNKNATSLSAGDLTVNGTDITGTFTDAASLKALIDGAGVSGLTATVNGGELDFGNTSASDVTFGGTLGLGLPATVDASVTTVTDGTAASTGVDTAVNAAAGTALNLGAGDLSIDGTDITGKFDSAQDLADAINSKGISGVSAYYDSASKELHLNAQSDLTVDGNKAGTGTGNLGFANAGNAVAVNGDLASANVRSVAGANDTISRIDSALSTVSNMRSGLGAVQNRFESTISNLQTISENLDASRSRIQDTDFAMETANMSRAQILQQAGVSMLAQANAAPQTVLKLLG